MKRWSGPSPDQLARRRAEARGYDGYDGGDDWLRRCAEYDAKGMAFYDRVLVDATYEEYMAEAGKSINLEHPQGGKEPGNLRGLLLRDGRLVWWNENRGYPRGGIQVAVHRPGPVPRARCRNEPRHQRGRRAEAVEVLPDGQVRF